MGGKASWSLSREVPESVYLDLQAALGITKHMGGLVATQELTGRCQIGPGKEILDVGCGTGKTPCFLAESLGCTVAAVDNSVAMIARAKERIRREGLDGKVRLRLADAQRLPFDDCLFDLVMVESVTAFVEDKAAAMEEYLRVTKPDGCMGLNETTWVKESPPDQIVDYVFRTTGARPETCAGWQGMLDHAGLRDVRAEVHRVTMLGEWVNEMKWLDLRDLLGPWFRIVPRYLTSSDARSFVRQLWPPPGDYFGYFGYGIYTGWK